MSRPRPRRALPPTRTSHRWIPAAAGGLAATVCLGAAVVWGVGHPGDTPAALQAVPVASHADDRDQTSTSRSGERPDLSAEQTARSATERAEALTKTSKSVAETSRKAVAKAEAEAKKAAEQKRKEEAAAEARAKALGYDPDETDPKAIAKQMAASKYGWTGAEWTCVDKIITQESTWRVTATNPSSGAYGLVQALPGSKMASAGSDWRTNPATQLKWGFGYIEDRYGTPCSAWSFHLANNWY